jgi:hypothetical protein
MVLSLPEPTKKTALCRAQEAVVGLDPSSALIWWDDVMWDYKFKEERPILMSRPAILRALLRKPRSYR